jgi:hypothetical protein
MRIITCASYYGTGSSAVTDLLSEFENDIYSFGEYEYRFIQDPDGISDLEFNIIENNHRHNTSYAIKRFIKYMHSLTEFGYGDGYKIFGKTYDILLNNYINSICTLKTKTWWHRDRIDKGILFSYIDRGYSLIKRMRNLKSEKRYSLLQNHELSYYTNISENDFLIATRHFVDSLFSSVSNKNILMIDQMIPPSNTSRYIRYFNDVKVIVVDRDPRDLFLLEKKQWQWGIIPTDDVNEFIEWFKITRNVHAEKDDPNKVMRIRFEDLIFDYDNTRNKIIEFVGVNKLNCTNYQQKFNPSISIKNTNLSIKYPEEKDNIDLIAKELKQYLYDF